MTVSREYVLDHFDEICDRAERGEEIVLERPGKVRLELVSSARSRTPQEAAESIRRRLHAQRPLEGVTIRELIEEGRRY